MPVLKNIFERYADAVEFSGIRLDAKILLVLTFVGMILGIVIGYFTDPALAILLPLIAIDLGLGLPFYYSNRKVEKIESKLPDVLHHMGTTLKTGGTIEVALREVSKIDYGPISFGLREMIREMSEGKTFEQSFTDFAVDSRSRLLEKAAIIIVAARISGGSLVDTLTAMSDDFRAVYRLERERRSKTFLQYLFIMVSGVLIAPLVFGIVKSVLQILVQVGGDASSESGELVSRFDTLFKFYLIVQAALAVIGAVQVREGKLSRAVIVIPFALLITYLIYVSVAGSFLGLLGA